jgi:DNA invertase Pin-like site-specific DNA recombinase
MSTGRQEHSPAQQREAIAAYVERKGYEIVREYADLGISGDRTDKRVQFQKMIRDAVAGQFDRIVCFDRSRFGRFDSLEFGKWCTPLREAGVDLDTVAEGVENWDEFGGRIVGLVQQEGKHAFLVDLSRATVRGQTAKARAARGFYGGPTPYGYIRHTRLEGRSRTSTLEPDKTTAAIVRKMFEAYAAPGGSLHGVVRMLTAMAAPTAGGGRVWRKNTVARILANRAYAGDYVWGRRQTGRYHTRKGDEIVRRRASDPTVFAEPIVHRDAVPPIVTRELFARVQQLLADRQKETRPASSVNPLSGLVVCRCCGKPMHSDGGNLLRCSSSASDQKDGRCSSARIPAGPLFEAVAGGLREKLLAPAAMKQIEKGLRARFANPRPAQNERAALEKRHRTLEAEVAEGLDRIPTVPRGILVEFTRSLDKKAAERDRLAAQLATLKRQSAGDGGGPAVARAMSALRDLRATLASGDSAAVNALLRTLGISVLAEPPARAGQSAGQGRKLVARVRVGNSSPTSTLTGQLPLACEFDVVIAL